MHPFQQTSNTGPVLRLALVNALLNVVTLSLWRFWGKTRVRRHLWSTTLAFGDPLTYTGTGRELFVGFLLVLLLVFLPLVMAYSVLQTVAIVSPGLAGLGFIGLYGVTMFLLGAGLYRARRYQLSRTRWRGIVCGQDGAAWKYGLLWLASSVLGPITLGLAMPWFQAKRARYLLSNTRIGDTKLKCDMGAGALYKRFILLIVCALVGLFLTNILIWSPANFSPLTWYEEREDIGIAFLISLVMMYLIMALPYAWYLAGYYRHMARSTSLTDQAFRFSAGSWGLIRLFLGNLVLTALSFGVLAPLTGLRLFRFAATHLEIEVEPNFALISQSEAGKAGSAEGIVEVFDGVGAF